MTRKTFKILLQLFYYYTAERIKLNRLIKGHIAVVFSGCVLIAFAVWLFLPLKLFNAPLSTVLFDRNGSLLGASISDDQQWRFPPLDSVPAKIAAAVIAFEDKRFYYHPGVDPFAICRALVQNLRKRHTVSGASTITMQLIRLSSEAKRRTVFRKIIEMLYAIRLELRLSKKRILALYISNAPFGGNVVGIEAASWRYFNREPKMLSWAEAATLAVLPNSPALIHPGRNRDILLAKRNRLLDKLRRMGILDSLSCELAKHEPLPQAPIPLPSRAPHLLQRVKLISSKYDPQTRRKQAEYSRVVTTIDGVLQDRATAIIQRHSKKLASNMIFNAAALIIDIPSTEVIAYIGNSGNENINGYHVDIITSPRSTGSILKPFLYAAMLESGELLPHQLVPDIPTRIGGFAPQNYSKTYDGAVPASMALARSLNIPAVYMLQWYGVAKFHSFLNKIGMSTLNRPATDYGLSLILGGAEATLWDITSMYAGIARCVNAFFDKSQASDGYFCIPKIVKGSHLPAKIKKGNSINHSALESPLGPASCWLTLQAMVEVARPDENNTWREFSSSKIIAWKTGTSFGFRDAWAVGVTPKYAIGVWVGNADSEGRPELTGISSAAPILFELFGLVENSGWFDCPEATLKNINVCEKSGYRALPNCVSIKTELVPRNIPETQACPFCRIIHCDKTRTYRVHSNCESVYDIVPLKWFVLPPSMEWYYVNKRSDYKRLPPWKQQCMQDIVFSSTPSLSIIYPRAGSQIYVPLDFDGKRGQIVFKVAHRKPLTTIFWHLDQAYLGATNDIHEMSCAPEPGMHLLVVVDENGEQSQIQFEVIGTR